MTAVGTRVMQCRVSSNKKSSALGPNNHDCRANCGGSSKKMVPDLAVEMLNNKNDDIFQVSTVLS